MRLFPAPQVRWGRGYSEPKVRGDLGHALSQLCMVLRQPKRLPNFNHVYAREEVCVWVSDFFLDNGGCPDITNDTHAHNNS